MFSSATTRRLLALAPAAAAAASTVGSVSMSLCDSTPLRVPSTCGWNAYGQLGLGHEMDRPSLEPIELLRPKSTTMLRSCGSCNSSAAITADGSLYTFGCGKDGRLGHGVSIEAPNQTIPRLVEGLSGKKVVDVAVGEYHMLALTDDGKVWSFGKNRMSQCGNDAKDSLPALVQGMEGVTASKIACGRLHSVILASDGRCYSFGAGRDGALGLEGIGRSNVKRPQLISGLFGKKIIDVAAGREFTLFLADNGVVYSTGNDDYGQCGQGFAHSRELTPVPVRGLSGRTIVKIVAGENHALVIADDGAVLSFGNNSHGQGGHGTRDHVGIPQVIEALKDETVVDGAAGGAHSLLLTESGKLFSFGRGRNGQLLKAAGLESIAASRTTPIEVTELRGKVSQVSAGESHSLAILKE